MNRTFQRKPYLAGLLIALGVLVIDQFSKFVIVYDIMARPHVIEVTSFFNIVMAWNRGVSFGMFGWDSSVKVYVLAAMAFGAAIGLLIWMVREGRIRFALPCGAIIGGALGNGIDRLHWGAVADFLDFHMAGYHWPAFNVADIGITCGATFLILDSLFSKTDSSKTDECEQLNSETAMKMSVLNFKNIAVLAIAVATLNACGDAKKMMGLEKTAPDEFAVYSRAPLSLPPDYSLKPPTPGAERPQAEDESIKAQRALTGRDVRPATGGENGYANMTPGLEMLLQQTGAAGADPSIRQKIDRETSAFIQESQSFTDDIMFWKNKEAFGTKVDAAKEAQRIREAQALGETVDGQGAVVIERKDQAILEGLFN